MAHGGEVLSDSTNLYYLDPLRHNYIYLYPQYINSKRTKQQGRRTSKANSIDNPTAQEIRDVCQAYNFETLLQPRKRFPQDPDMDPMHIGRVRIKLKNEDGAPCNPEFDTKMKVINLCGQRIPKLNSRQQKQGGAGGGGSHQSSNQNEENEGGKGKGSKKKGGRKR